jgi:hypothetical protein
MPELISYNFIIEMIDYTDDPSLSHTFKNRQLFGEGQYHGLDRFDYFYIYCLIYY